MSLPSVSNLSARRSLLLLLVSWTLLMAVSHQRADARSLMYDIVVAPAATLSKRTSADDNAGQSEACARLDSQSYEVVALLDKVCETCHELFSHGDPNIRSSCRRNCFANSHFKKCVRVFRTTGFAAPPVRRRLRRNDAVYE